MNRIVWMVRHKKSGKYMYGAKYNKVWGSFAQGRIYTGKGHASNSANLKDNSELELVGFALVEAMVEENQLKIPVRPNPTLTKILENTL